MNNISIDLFLNNIFHSLKHSNKTHIDIDFVKEQIKKNIKQRIEELKNELEQSDIQMGMSVESMKKIIDIIFYDGNIKPDSEMSIRTHKAIKNLLKDGGVNYE